MIVVVAFVALALARVEAAISGWAGTPSPVAWWSASSIGATTLSADITVEQDNTKGYYYYAVQSYFEDDTIFYGGIQINGSNGSGAVIPRMAIFSVWDTYSGTAAPGGWATTFGGEGTGYSVRIPYNWEKGVAYTITYSLTSDDGITKVWHADITNIATGETTLIGSINVASKRGKIKPIAATFHERFAGSTNSCAVLEPSRANIANVRIGGEPATIYSQVSGTTDLCANSGIGTGGNQFLSWFNAPPGTPVASTPQTPAPTPIPPTTVKPVTKVSPPQNNKNVAWIGFGLFAIVLVVVPYLRRRRKETAPSSDGYL